MSRLFAALPLAATVEKGTSWFKTPMCERISVLQSYYASGHTTALACTRTDPIQTLK